MKIGKVENEWCLTEIEVREKLLSRSKNYLLSTIKYREKCFGRIRPAWGSRGTTARSKVSTQILFGPLADRWLIVEMEKVNRLKIMRRSKKVVRIPEGRKRENHVGIKEAMQVIGRLIDIPWSFSPQRAKRRADHEKRRPKQHTSWGSSDMLINRNENIFRWQMHGRSINLAI